MELELEPGCYIDGWWGHYQSIRVIELGMSLGYKDSALDDDNLNALAKAYEDNVEELTLTHKDGSPLELDPRGYSVADCVYETADDVIDYINEHHVDTEKHWFGHHPDLGDVGVWEYEYEDDE